MTCRLETWLWIDYWYLVAAGLPLWRSCTLDLFEECANEIAALAAACLYASHLSLSLVIGLLNSAQVQLCCVLRPSQVADFYLYFSKDLQYLVQLCRGLLWLSFKIFHGWNDSMKKKGPQHWPAVGPEQRVELGNSVAESTMECIWRESSVLAICCRRLINR